MTGAAVVVTGAAGFLGAHVARALVASGARVRGAVQHAEHARAWRSGEVEPLVADLLAPAQLRAALRGAQTVYHCAAKIPDKGNAEEIWQVNVNGTRNLLEACVVCDVPRVVFVSSDSVYGDGHLPASREDQALRPEYFHEGNYPRSKLAGEELVREFHARGALAASIVRPCLMYGPGESSGTTFLTRLAARRLHRLVMGGRARLSLGYVEDVAQAVLLAAQAQASGETYNVCDAQAYNMREIVEVLCAARGRRCLALPLPERGWALTCRLLHPGLQRLHGGLAQRFDPELLRFLASDHVMSIDKARRELGYRPGVGLAEGVRRMFAWLEAPTPLL